VTIKHVRYGPGPGRLTNAEAEALDGTHRRGAVRGISGFLLALGALACAPASVRPDPDAEAILARGGGLSGIAETIRIWSTSGEPEATSRLSNESRSRTIRLPRKTLDSSLVAIESLVTMPPQIAADTGLLRPLCADVILTRIEFRRGSRAQSSQEECPHRTPASESYWQRVDSLFRLLAAAAQ
jgi:hypothetical protein